MPHNESLSRPPQVNEQSENLPDNSYAEPHIPEHHRNLINENAQRIARKLPTLVDSEDLAQEGYAAYIDAMKRYQQNNTVVADNLITKRVRGAMIDYLRKNDFLSQHTRFQIKKIREAQRLLRKTFGREPTRNEVATHLAIPLIKVEETEGYAGDPVNIDDIEIPFETKVDENYVATFEEQKKLNASVADFIATGLTPREKEVLNLYYRQQYSQKEISTILHLTEGRVSQLISEIQKKFQLLGKKLKLHD